MNFLGLTHPLCSSLAALRAQWVGMSPEMLPTSDGVLGRGAMASPEPSARHPWGCLRMLSRLCSAQDCPVLAAAPGEARKKPVVLFPPPAVLVFSLRREPEGLSGVTSCITRGWSLPLGNS